MKKKERIGVRNTPNGKIVYFDDAFEAMQYQRQTAWGRMWLHTPMQIHAYPYLRDKGKKK